MQIALAFLFAVLGLAAEVGGLRAIHGRRMRQLAGDSATLERDLGIGVPLDARIAEAWKAWKDGLGKALPWDGFTLERIDSDTDPDKPVYVWPAGLSRQRRPRM